MLQTCGLAQQHGMGADSACFPKKRLTHNLLFLITYKDCSIKSQVNLEPFPEIIYGWYFLRVVHFIVSLQVSFPSKILLTKYNYFDAFQKISHLVSAAAKTILVVAGMAYIMLCLSFGGIPNLPNF